jgi:hypothetical protein
LLVPDWRHHFAARMVDAHGCEGNEPGTQRRPGNTTMKKRCLTLALLTGAIVLAAGAAEAQRSGASA